MKPFYIFYHKCIHDTKMASSSLIFYGFPVIIGYFHGKILHVYLFYMYNNWALYIILSILWILDFFTMNRYNVGIERRGKNDD